MAQGARGEAILTVDGESRAVLFTNRALAQAEKAVGKPMLRLLHGLQESDLGIEDAAQLLAIGLEFGRRDAKAGGKPITLDDAWKVMDALGFTATTVAVVGAVAAVLSYDAEGEGGQESAAQGET